MTMEEPRTVIHKQDVEDVAAKLEAFIAGLPEHEQNVLGLILARAAGARESDVEGFYRPTAQPGFSPFASQLVQSAGFSHAGLVQGFTMSVAWGSRFLKPGSGGSVSNPSLHS